MPKAFDAMRKRRSRDTIEVGELQFTGPKITVAVVMPRRCTHHSLRGRVVGGCSSAVAEREMCYFAPRVEQVVARSAYSDLSPRDHVATLVAERGVEVIHIQLLTIRSGH